jgi:hypothetical protein
MALIFENNRQARLPRSVAEPSEAHRGQQARRGQGRTVKVSWRFGVARFPVDKETWTRIGGPGNSERKISPMIVIERDGRFVVITGWRAWLLTAVALVATIAVLAAVAFLVLGIAVSVVAFVLIILPAVVILALVAWIFQPRRA